MKLTVPTNWQQGLIDQIKRPSVNTVYGKMDWDFVGGGRSSCILERVSKSNVEAHISKIHKEGLKFHYLLNGTCLGNREFTQPGRKELDKLLDWLSQLNVDGVVVSLPFLLQYVKKNYPGFKISVSCLANINSVEKAMFWEDLGADQITLSVSELNRDFKLLQEIRRNIVCSLQLIVNQNCLQDCPLYFYHSNIASHSSQSSIKQNISIDYCILMCSYKRILEPVNFIRASWIRPEDLIYYEKIGINSFKLVDRAMHVEAIALAVEAYSKRSYRGNLYDLFLDESKSLICKKLNLFEKRKNYTQGLSGLEVCIDNTKLDGFIEHFLNTGCRYKSCKKCGYCYKIAARTVRIEPKYRKKALNNFDILFNKFFLKKQIFLK